jgi:hypothetical protein
VRKHELDLTSLVAGLVFVAIALAYLVGAVTKVHIDAGWVLPFGLVGLGAAGLAGSLRVGLRRDAEADAVQADVPAEVPGANPS